jgi:hypothetical protein
MAGIVKYGLAEVSFGTVDDIELHGCSPFAYYKTIIANVGFLVYQNATKKPQK